MNKENLYKFSNLFKPVTYKRYTSFNDLILNKKKSKTFTISHIIKYFNTYYSIKVYDSISDDSDTKINKTYNLEITKVTPCNKYAVLNNYEYRLNHIKNLYLLVNKRLININVEAINYRYNNFVHKKLCNLLYITINLELTDISDFIWSNNDIKNQLISNTFTWESSINDLIINEGCPLLAIDNFGNIRILGIYYCKTVDYINNEYEPLLWFIPSYTIIHYVSQVYKNDISHNYNIINDYKIEGNKLIITEDYKINDTLIIPKNSILISYNNKLLLYGENIRDKIYINFSSYQVYDYIKKISFKYNNKYYIKNVYVEYKNLKLKYYIPVFYNYNKTSYYNYKGFIFIKVSLEFVNYILSCNLIIDSYPISFLLENPITNYDEQYIYCLISCPLQYLDKLDKQTYLYKVLNNLLLRWIGISNYLEERPQMIYLPIIKGNINFNKPIINLDLLIDTNTAYRINL